MSGHEKSSKDEVIEIPVGKYLGRLRDNPWIVATFVFGIAFVLSLVFGGGGSGGVGSERAADNALAFFNSNPQLQGQVELVNSERTGNFYEVLVGFQGDQLPVYVTLDGNYMLAGAPIPLDGSSFDSRGSVGSGTGEVVDSGTGSAAQISEDDDPILGSPSAPVTIIEFSDYQCPFCQKFWAETLPQLKTEYLDTGKAKLVYRDYPLPIHDQAQVVAEAVECVRAQGGDKAYFEMHDQVFAEQPNINRANLELWAKDLGYDITSCLDNGEFTSEVQKDFEDGGRLGTPTFFINGKKLEGALPFDLFKQVINAELAAIGL